MKKLVFVFVAILAIAFISCEKNEDETATGVVTFDLSGLNLEVEEKLKSASSNQTVEINATINGTDYALYEGDQVILPVIQHTVTKFDIIIDGVHVYMIGEAVDFLPIANDVVSVQIPVFRVDDTSNQYGKGEFNVVESAYHAIKSGRSSYPLYYSTENASRLVYAANIQNSAADGFPVLRLYNGYSDVVVEYTYWKYGTSDKYTYLVGPNTQLYILLPGGKSAAGTWKVESDSFSKTISIN